MLIDAPDGASIAEAIRWVLGDETHRREMGCANQRRARSLYAFPVVADRLAALYEDVIGLGTSGSS